METAGTLTEPAKTRKALLRWYDKHGRSLPWRETRDAYAIWVSEIMCQQTRVDTVIPYFQRFMARFPTAASLAAADQDQVLGMWSGLGYYRRARLLHAGVKEVVATYGGSVPGSHAERLALPGIGRYTAGAIGSIAFGHEEAVVDGNVARVLSRVCLIEDPVGTSSSTKALWREAGRLVLGSRPGDLNQALMELGALVCSPKNPSCDVCPIRPYCQAFEKDRTLDLPKPKKKKPPKEIHLVAVVPRSSNRVWLSRGEGTLFGGLWGVPLVELPHGDHGDTHTEARKVARRALTDFGLKGRLPSTPTGFVQHVLTHRRMLVEVWRATGVAPRAGTEKTVARAFEPTDLDGVGIARLTRKLLEV